MMESVTLLRNEIAEHLAGYYSVRVSYSTISIWTVWLYTIYDDQLLAYDSLEWRLSDLVDRLLIRESSERFHYVEEDSTHGLH